MALSIGAGHELDGRHISLETIEDIAVRNARVTIAPAARERVAAARAAVERQYELGAIIYGVTTGFGRMANVVIDRHDTAALQLNLVRSHAAGTGAPLPEAQVRAAGVLRASSLAAGHSGIKLETLDLLCELLNRGVTPVVPSQGSVGASGDLAPLAHMTLTLIGEGEATFAGERLPSSEALRRAGLAPIVLTAKEGLSLVNGTEVMTGIAALAVLACGAPDRRRRRHRRAVARSVLGDRSRFRLTDQCAAPASRPGARGRQPARAAARFGDHALASRVRPGAGPVFVPLHPGRPRRRARSGAPHADRWSKSNRSR